MSKIGGYVKSMIRSWLNVQEASGNSYHINEKLDFDGVAIRNRIWYRGDPYELNQFYHQLGNEDSSFWSMVPEASSSVRKMHSGLPALIVDTLSNIVVRDLGKIEVDKRNLDWEAIEKDNHFSKLIAKVVTETLYLGDGAIKISIDRKLTDYPIIEFYSADQVEFVYERGRYKETIFKNIHNYNHKTYIHYEHYGFGYIKNYLREAGSNENLDLGVIPQTAKLADYSYAGYKEDKEGNMLLKGSFNMAIPVKIFNSAKFSNRGKSIFENKISSFDAFDEVISQWLDAVRMGRAIKYIPESLIPRNKTNGKLLKPNDFEHKFVEIKGTMAEKEVDHVQVEQPAIPTENYLQSYITYLDQCLQGLISPSTLGIDTKKLDNAEAQREKEKTTLYTRGIIVDMLQELIPNIVNTSLKVLDAMNSISSQVNYTDEEITVQFGEYANPSFEAVVETMSKARPGQPVMSIEAIVEELYGESKDEDWKAKEVQRIKEDAGVTSLEEPGMLEEEVEDLDDEKNNFIN